MRKNDKNLEIKTAGIVRGTNIHFVELVGGAVYYRLKDICKYRQEQWPGELRDVVSIISGHDYRDAHYIEEVFRYVRVWFDGHVYIHYTDVRNYVLEREAFIENRLVFTRPGRVGGWSIEAMQAIKKLFNIEVRCTWKHEKLTVSEEIADQFAGNPKLRAAWKAEVAIQKAQAVQHRLAPYWAQAIELKEEIAAVQSEEGEAE